LIDTGSHARLGAEFWLAGGKGQSTGSTCALMWLVWTALPGSIVHAWPLGEHQSKAFSEWPVTRPQLPSSCLRHSSSWPLAACSRPRQCHQDRLHAGRSSRVRRRRAIPISVGPVSIH
jgi:hypothetical protein